jgi:acetoin:2,6-dichlorophenolindophenol oxidoreductase subunit beta
MSTTEQAGASTANRLAPAICDAIAQEMRQDDRILFWGEDIRTGVMSTSQGLVKEFGPERIIDTPISEGAFLGAALGAAASGLRPIVEIMYSTFTYVAFDQLVNQVGKARYMTDGQITAPLTVIAATGASGFAAQHSDSSYPMFMNAAGLRIVFPSNAHQAFWLTRAALRSDDPTIVLNQPALAGSKGEVRSEPMELGDVEVTSYGNDVSVFAIGLMAHRARKLAKRLSESDGIGVEVVDVCSLSPFPADAIVESVRRTGRAVIADEARLACSAASEIGSTIAEKAFDALRAPIQRVAVPNVPIPYAPPLESYVIPDEADIEAAIRKVVR